MHQPGELGIVSGGQLYNLDTGLLAQEPKGAANVGWKEILVRLEQTGALMELVKNLWAKARAKVMERREIVSPSRGKPIGPA